MGLKRLVEQHPDTEEDAPLVVSKQRDVESNSTALRNPRGIRVTTAGSNFAIPTWTTATETLLRQYTIITDDFDAVYDPQPDPTGGQ